MQWTNEGGEVSELGGAHLHEGKFRSTYMGEANIKNKNTIALIMTKWARLQSQDNSFLIIPSFPMIDWLGCEILEPLHTMALQIEKPWD